MMQHRAEETMNPDIYNCNTSLCSCQQCDSKNCFTLRNKKQCLSNKCTPLNTRYNIQIYEVHTQTAMKLDNLSHKQANTVTKSGTKVDKADVNNTENMGKELFKKEFTYKYSNDDFETKKIIKDSQYSILESHNAAKDSISAEVKRGSSTTFAYPRQEFTDTAKLSAQIMNVPYKDFKDSIYYSKSQATPTKVSELNKYDILRRIKEAYDACSCKVCECLVGKSSISYDNCKCMPCECADCKAFTKNLQVKKAVNRSSGCPCVRCDGNCKAINDDSGQESECCDCDPYKGVHFLSTNLLGSDNPCNCRPCECIECKSYALTKPMTTIVGRIREEVPRNCQCAPCDCAECGQNFPMASSLRHEMSTGINRPMNCTCETCMNQSCEAHDSDTCSCQVQKRVMRKPVERDTRDYDIHSAFVKNKNVLKRGNGHNNIAMYATLRNNKPRFEQPCSCSICECIVCSRKDKTATAIKASQLFEPMSVNKDSCECEPCECEICNTYISYGIMAEQRDKMKDCKCKPCDCLNCENNMKASRSVSFTKNVTNKVMNKAFERYCTCDPCECNECQLKRNNDKGHNGYHKESSQYEVNHGKTKFINETIFCDTRNNDIDSIPFRTTVGNTFSNTRCLTEDNYLEKPLKEWKIVQKNKEQSQETTLSKPRKGSLLNEKCITTPLFDYSTPKSVELENRFHDASKKSVSVCDLGFLSTVSIVQKYSKNNLMSDVTNYSTQLTHDAVISRDVETLTLPKIVSRNQNAMQTDEVERDVSVATAQNEALSSNAVSNNDIAINNKDNDIFGRANWSILQKNICFTKDYFRINNKQDEQGDELTRNQHGNKGLLRLQEEIKKLMDIKLVPSTEDLYYEERSQANSKSNSKCDLYKVKSLSLRKISDNTVLMKWQLPQEVADVLAYELLVDGRSVQKMSPSRCMAVVGCLPNVDKLVMTVRTLLNYLPECGHYPSSTAVYHPRAR